MDAEMKELEIELRHLRRQIATYQWEFKVTEDVDIRTEILRNVDQCIDIYTAKVHQLSKHAIARMNDAQE